MWFSNTSSVQCPKKKPPLLLNLHLPLYWSNPQAQGQPVCANDAAPKTWSDYTSNVGIQQDNIYCFSLPSVLFIWERTGFRYALVLYIHISANIVKIAPCKSGNMRPFGCLVTAAAGQVEHMFHAIMLQLAGHAQPAALRPNPDPIFLCRCCCCQTCSHQHHKSR